MSNSKIHLSPKELELVRNADLLLTKNIIIEKVYELFGSVARGVQQLIEEKPIPFPQEILIQSPKISKGENYKGLPYVMLDYPRCFGKENSFAIRSFFWWGNFFSVTLHLKGIYKEKYLPELKKNIELLRKENFFIASSEDEWNHVIEPEHYFPMKAMDSLNAGNLLADKVFLKLSSKLELEHWNDSEEMLLNIYRMIFIALGY